MSFHTQGRLTFADQIFDLHKTMQFIALAQPGKIPCFAERKYRVKTPWYKSTTWAMRWWHGENRERDREIIKHTVDRAIDLLPQVNNKKYSHYYETTLNLLIAMASGIRNIMNEYPGDDDTRTFYLGVLRELRHAVPMQYQSLLPDDDIHTFTDHIRPENSASTSPENTCPNCSASSSLDSTY